MSLLMGMNMLAMASARVAKVTTTQNASVDPIMVFGFFATFCTLVVLMYQHKMRSRMPLLVVCLAALSVYGFVEGTWSLGFSLAALSASEFARWYPKRHRSFVKRANRLEPSEKLYDEESRVERMFGSL